MRTATEARVRRHLPGLLVAVITFNVAMLCLPVIDFQLGRVEARWDLLQGRRQFKRCIANCVAAEPTRKWESLLAVRFGFNTITVEDCGRRTFGYDDFQREEFNRLFGRGAFEKEADDFHRRWVRELREEASRDHLKW